ncbi:hypothetical protein Arub01_12940 [Actinomadura rubrobrunea]|uniref:DUF485 domain-containing protein n=1 Tax=Actinomadura rubrobrunea TaxID=115335 RepID=A0A9W6UVV8_9ACTN|nr:hypothetical protein [Actinomadura rubrobrunea]GLW63050.1 hypothetical protein Arub01_12940 [Actinomadura rubrobrunea]
MTEPRRVAVSSPRAHRARGQPVGTGWSIARDLDERTEPGAVDARALIRAQLRSALLTAGLVLGAVLGLPLLLLLVPALARTRVCGMPLAWPLLVLCVQPVWIVLAVRQLRRAERTEREFARRVDRV